MEKLLERSQAFESALSTEASALSDRAKKVVLLRMVPFVERNYNMVELGPQEVRRTREIAAAQVERLRRQSVYMNDLYQVNAQVVAAHSALSPAT